MHPHIHSFNYEFTGVDVPTSSEKILRRVDISYSDKDKSEGFNNTNLRIYSLLSLYLEASKVDN